MTAQADVKASRIVGIDLGTSNCAVASVDLAGGAAAPLVDFPIPQLVRAGEVSSLALLPSCLYLAGEHELSREATRLPWGHEGSPIVGQFARWQGSRVPGRGITSAKSWLCHAGVDRGAPILPWGAPEEVTKLSPVTASAQLLQHLVRAWDFAHPQSPLASCEVVVTVPASFDEVARALTVNAARQAGLDKFTLVEEPQAAFYDFTAQHRNKLGVALKDVRLVMVVDVGGGTSDFTLVQVALTNEGPLLRRIAVGDHLMLGGDNMDAGLARKVEETLAGGRKLSSAQWTQLVQAARQAKEALLGDNPPEHYNVSLVVESSKLIGGTLSGRITRAQAEEIILEGFFPRCAPDELPQRLARTALQEMGLPYAQEPAVTKHIAAFLQRHAAACFEALGIPPGPERTTLLPRPDAILLNGGVFNSPRIAQRLRDAVSSWWPDALPITLLEHRSLELAVARGAAYYGLVRHGHGRRISGGAARAFYVGLAGEKKDTHALCVIPRGHEEGETVEIGERVFQLAVGTPVQFPLYSTSADRVDAIGAIVPITEELQPLPPIHSLLKGSTGKTGVVPVHLRAGLTEIGTLELWCVSNNTDERWRLEFELRGTATDPQSTVIESMPARFSEAREWIVQIYGSRLPRATTPATAGAPRPEAPKEPKHLWGSLEKFLGPREQWRVPLLRELWGALHAGAAKRRRSAQHERIYFQLAGYTLRPGFGYPLDEWRCTQTFELFPEAVQFHKEKAVWTEYWILWRRIAGGLNPEQQQRLWDYLKAHLSTRLLPVAARQLGRPKGVQPDGWDEMVRTAASLEHLPASEKIELGGWILARLREPSTPPGGPWSWAMGRLGARVLVYGSDHNTVAPAVAVEWLSQLLKLGSHESVLFAIAQLARRTGDRARDIDDATRSKVADALRNSHASEVWLRMVTDVVVLESAEQARVLGDTLPAGLRLKTGP